MQDPNNSSNFSAAAPARQGRPRLSLSDDQARRLVQQTEILIAKHAGNPGQHRDFVHDFLRAVHHATGQTFGSAMYRKLLQAYAPGRSPSTATIESEKIQLLRELSERGMQVADATVGQVDVQTESNATPAPPSLQQPAPGTDLALQEVVSLLHYISGKVEALTESRNQDDGSHGLKMHNQFLLDRLSHAEAELASVRALAARSTSIAQENAALAAERGAALEAAQAATAAQTVALEKLTKEFEGQRAFALRAMDDVRGETRAFKDRVVYLEGRLKEMDRELDTYRQMVLNRAQGGQNGSAR